LKKILMTLAVVMFAVIPATSPAGAAPASWWKPSSAHALPMQWVLDTRNGGVIDVNDPCSMGQRGLGCIGTLAQPAVMDVDGDYNTRDASTSSTAHVSRGVGEAFQARGQFTICYMDAGVQEASSPGGGRLDREAPYTFPADRQAEASDWGGWWIDFTAPGNGTTQPDPRVLAVIEKRIQDWCLNLIPVEPNLSRCGAQRCGGIEFDEVDYWENTGGGYPDVTYNSQLAYNKALYDLAHKYGLAVIHKGDLAQVRDLEPYADATLNEECAQYKECLDEYGPTSTNPRSTSCTERSGVDPKTCGLRVFSTKGKAVWEVEYKSTAYKVMCVSYNPTVNHFNGARMKLGLPSNGGRQPCTGTW
jgi:hypothetical protein